MMNKVTGITQQGMGQLADGTLLERTLPGEVVEVTADGGARILTPSADRVAAPCRHFKSCGGCRMQHASDDFVADWKKGIVEKALSARDLPFPFRALHTSPASTRRRAKFGARRTKQGAQIGFHARGTHTIVDVPDCKLLLPSILAARPALEALTKVAASRKSEISLIVTDSLAGLDVVVDTERDLTNELRVELTAIATQFGLARLVWRDETIVTLNAPIQKFGSANVVPPAGAFLQATLNGEAALQAAVADAVGPAKRIADLFAGCGTFSLPLAESADIFAVEGDRGLTEALDAGWRKATGLHQVQTEVRDLFRRPLEPDELARFDAVIMDPPRAGAAAQSRTLAASSVKRVAMVSCNPITFARDVETLCDAGFEIQWIDVVDQFRWAAHVEVVALLTRS